MFCWRGLKLFRWSKVTFASRSSTKPSTTAWKNNWRWGDEAFSAPFQIIGKQLRGYVKELHLAIESITSSFWTCTFSSRIGIACAVRHIHLSKVASKFISGISFNSKTVKSWIKGEGGGICLFCKTLLEYFPQHWPWSCHTGLDLLLHLWSKHCH